MCLRSKLKTILSPYLATSLALCLSPFLKNQSLLPFEDWICGSKLYSHPFCHFLLYLNY